MKIINLILASGRGSRLFPVSTEARPKQFLKLVTDKMLIEDTIERFRPYVNETYIVTLKKYEKYVRKLENVKVVYEDERKESATSVYKALQEIYNKNRGIDVTIVQTPSDHFIQNGMRFKNAVKDAIDYAESDYFSVIGVEPKQALSSLGYVKDYKKLVEKPSKKEAKKLMESGYKWNTAIYSYSLSDMIFYFENLYQGEKISFEKAILSGFGFDMRVVNANFVWMDIGTREALEDYEAERWKGLKGFQI